MPTTGSPTLPPSLRRHSPSLRSICHLLIVLRFREAALSQAAGDVTLAHNFLEGWAQRRVRDEALRQQASRLRQTPAAKKPVVQPVQVPQHTPSAAAGRRFLSETHVTP